MNSNKLLRSIVFLAFSIAIVVSGCSVISNEDEPDDIRSVAEKISGYQVPSGYSEQFAVDLLGYQLVSLTGATPNCHLYLIQPPKDSEVDVEKLQEQARSMSNDRQRDTITNIQVVDTQEIMLRGSETTLVVGEGINSDNLPYREVTALFEGRNGPALVSISSPVDLWNWDMVDEFLASLE